MGSVPIGAALADEDGNVIAQGRSMQFEKQGTHGQVVWSKLSHAELNALLQVSAHDHPNIRSYTLYTTMEPCPLCTGALVMSNVRNVCYAAPGNRTDTILSAWERDCPTGVHLGKQWVDEGTLAQYVARKTDIGGILDETLSRLAGSM